MNEQGEKFSQESKIDLEAKNTQMKENRERMQRKKLRALRFQEKKRALARKRVSLIIKEQKIIVPTLLTFQIYLQKVFLNR